ncbi:MAG: PDZ domain-containing protein [Oscillospiraceae bacterium]|nr:PDZ domain-containing protein [Oscillospiraceae bacterium]
MYKNAGKKILYLAQILTIIMAVAAFIIGLVMAAASNNFLVFLGIAIGGSFFAWLSNLVLAGFGELIENTHELLKIARVMSPSGYSQSTSAPAEFSVANAGMSPKSHDQSTVTPVSPSVTDIGIKTENVEFPVVGVRIKSIAPNSVAATAGLTVADIITDLGGTKIRLVSELYNVLSSYHIGDTTTITIRRGHEDLTLPLIFNY